MLDFWGRRSKFGIYPPISSLSSLHKITEYYLPEIWSRLDEYVQWQVSTCREVLPAWNIYFIK